MNYKCEFQYTHRYYGYSFTYTKTIILPFFPHKDMMIIDGDNEIELKDRYGCRVDISYYVDGRKIIVSIEEFGHIETMEELNSALALFDGWSWKRDFGDKQIDAIRYLINQKKKEGS